MPLEEQRQQQYQADGDSDSGSSSTSSRNGMPPSLRSLSSQSSLYSRTSSRSLTSCNSFCYESTRKRLMVKLAWLVHFASCLLVLLIGVWSNSDSKYVPIPPERAGPSCDRAFLNVMASSGDEEEAIVCCNYADHNIANICPSESSGLPLAGRLARFPDAWFLPLFPLLLRILYTSYRGLLSAPGNRLFEKTSNCNSCISMAALRRLGYYILLLNFRGWFLYVALNGLEDLIVQTDSEDCWYHDYLRPDQHECFGRVFDFSDHIVLYYAQILPIALVEFVHSLEYPYWTVLTGSKPQHVYNSSPRNSWQYHSMDWSLDRLLPFILCIGMAYLYLITYLGVYKTATFFHTGSEVLVGYLVSLVVHVPLCCMQCTDRCERLRDFLFAAEPSNTFSNKNLR